MVSKTSFPACSSAALLLVTLSGCASLPQDWGRAGVAEATAARGQTLPSGDTQQLSQQLLAQPLTADNAITLALIHNPAVRLTTARLGIAAADVYDAARIANPLFSASRLTSSDPAAVSAQIGLGIAVSFTDLILLPARSRYAKARFEAVKLEVGSAAMTLASEVEAAWYRAAGAEQAATLRSKVAEAAESSAGLAQRFFDAGNINKREIALERAAAAQAQLDAQAAQAEAVLAHSALNRLMGLSAAQEQWALAGGVPAPYANEDGLDDLLKLANESRLDLTAAQKNAQSIAGAYGLERKTAWLGPIDIGLERERETDGSRLLGPTLSWQIPLFNWGSGRTARAKALLESAEAELSAKQLDTSNQVKAAHASVLAAKARAERYRTGLIPQREAVVEQMQREVNYMLIGVFELLAAKQQEYDAYAGYLDAVRDYWIARADLSRAVGRRLPSSSQAVPAALDATTLTTPKDTGMGHMGHGGMNHGAMEHDMSSMPGEQMQGKEGMEGRSRPEMKPGKPSAKKKSPRTKQAPDAEMPVRQQAPADQSSPTPAAPPEHHGHTP